MSLLFSGRSFTVTPQPNGSYVNGKWVTGAPGTSFIVSGTLHNAPDYVLQTLPEGKRDQGAQILITDGVLAITDPIAQTSGDIVSIDGFDWQVEQAARWGNGILPNNEYLLIRAKEGT